jgi:hypothetical protein
VAAAAWSAWLGLSFLSFTGLPKGFSDSASRNLLNLFLLFLGIVPKKVSVPAKRCQKGVETDTFLPEQIPLRMVEIRVAVPGFRTQKIVLITTLLDADKYTVAELGQLYFPRWAVELFFRDIKITLGMDVLRCQTPAMVQKEIAMHAIAYNLIRALMQDIAQSYQIQLSRLSFKGTIDALRQWSELFQTSRAHPQHTQKIRRWFYYTIATDPLIARPNRSEPRAVKRRPENFRLLTKPRKEIIVERCRKWSQKPANNALN